MDDRNAGLGERGHLELQPDRAPTCAGIPILHFALIGCAMGGDVVQHSFQFDTLMYSPDAEVLDYQYGSSGKFGTYANKERVQHGSVFTAWSTGGLYPRGEYLYVKWRLKSSGQVYEDKADLRTRLPADIKDHILTCVIKGSQLYVYLICPEKRAPTDPVGPIRTYSHLKQSQIYPDSVKSTPQCSASGELQQHLGHDRFHRHMTCHGPRRNLKKLSALQTAHRVRRRFFRTAAGAVSKFTVCKRRRLAVRSLSRLKVAIARTKIIRFKTLSGK